MSEATADLADVHPGGLPVPDRTPGANAGEAGVGVDDDQADEGLAQDALPFDSARFAAMYPELRRLAAAVAPPRTEPDELVHEAVARMLARTRRSGPVRDPQAYLARSIINLARSRRRAWVRRRAAAPAPRLTTSAPAEPDELAALLDQLHPRQRAVLWLRFVEDRSVSETAEVLGCSEGTVKSQTSKALAALRRSPDLRTRPTTPDPEAGNP